MQIIAYTEATICLFYLLLLEAARLEVRPATRLEGRLEVRLATRLEVRLEVRPAVRLAAVRLEDRFGAAFFTRFAIIYLLNLLVFLS